MMNVLLYLPNNLLTNIKLTDIEYTFDRIFFLFCLEKTFCVDELTKIPRFNNSPTTTEKNFFISKRRERERKIEFQKASK